MWDREINERPALCSLMHKNKWHFTEMQSLPGQRRHIGCVFVHLCLNVSNPVWAGITQKRTRGRDSTKSHRLTIECIHKAFGRAARKRLDIDFQKKKKKQTKQNPIQYHAVCNPTGAAAWIHHSINWGDAPFVKISGPFGVWQGCNCLCYLTTFIWCLYSPCQHVVWIARCKSPQIQSQTRLPSEWIFHVHRQSHCTGKKKKGAQKESNIWDFYRLYKALRVGDKVRKHVHKLSSVLRDRKLSIDK